MRVSPCGDCDWEDRPPSPRQRDHDCLPARIREIHEHSQGTTGAPGRHDDLTDEGETASKHRIARLMAVNGPRGRPRKQKRGQQGTTGTLPIGVGNHPDRDFLALEPETRWVTDITECKTDEGQLYLCVVITLFSKPVIGWSMRHRQARQRVRNAVEMAVWQRQGGGSVILHADRGRQFRSGDYQRFLKRNTLICSMSTAGHCSDNAPREGFFGLLKREQTNHRRYQTRDEARADVFHYIERLHNPPIRPEVARKDQQFSDLFKPSVKSG